MSESKESQSETRPNVAPLLRNRIVIAKRNLDLAREHGDLLAIDLAEDALNDLLTRLSHLQQVTDE
jgi:hypothetical protein